MDTHGRALVGQRSGQDGVTALTTNATVHIRLRKGCAILLMGRIIKTGRVERGRNVLIQ